jgi:sugar phosphate isomerase/epimerase
MRDFTGDLAHLSINTATLRKQLNLLDIIECCARRGIQSLCPWRDQVQAAGLRTTARRLADAGLGTSGYCRGGFFPAADPAGLATALEDNRAAIDEAKALNAPCLVLVVGSLPGALAGKPASKDIARARAQVYDGIAATLEYAQRLAMPLAIEPLHPMQGADRSCINTLSHALDICDALDAVRSGMLGVAVDVYHTWWDPQLEVQIRRAGSDRLLAYHVCDWLVPTRDLLNDRGMMGDGIVELQKIRGWVEDAGYTGAAEVEIFSERWWAVPASEVLDICASRYQSVV